MKPNQMTDFNLLKRQTAEKLKNADSPETDASELIRFVFGLSKTDILMNPKRAADDEQLARFEETVAKRASGYPLQYILGEWDFYGLTFKIAEGVLIPRNETEQLADAACRFLRNKKNAVVFDICSGSGCIGLSVALNNPMCRVYLFDIAKEALHIQKINKDRFSLDNVTILDYDIFSGFEECDLPKPDVILCNPPYVTKEEYSGLQKEIFFEPESAIVAPEDGLVFYRCLAEKWLGYLKNGGFFMFECGEEQPKKVIDIIKNVQSLCAGDYKIRTEKDLYGVCRFVSGIKTEADIACYSVC